MLNYRRSVTTNCVSLAVLALATYAAPAFAQEEAKPVTAWEASRTIDDDATVKTGVAKAFWSWNWGWCPGIIPFFIVCLLTFWIHHMSREKIKETFKDTWDQVQGAVSTWLTYAGAAGTYLLGGGESLLAPAGAGPEQQRAGEAG